MNTRLKFWLITVATVAAVGTTSSLGVWQLSRAADKLALQETMDARRALPQLDGATLRDPALAACFVQAKPGAARRVDPAKLSSYIHKRTAPEVSDGG